VELPSSEIRGDSIVYATRRCRVDAIAMRPTCEDRARGMSLDDVVVLERRYTAPRTWVARILGAAAALGVAVWLFGPPDLVGPGS
jgi:hypothetical protein